MIKTVVLLGAILWLVGSTPATSFAGPITASELLPKRLKACGSGRVKKVISGDKFQLMNGKTILLAEVKAPEYWPPGAPYRSWPYAKKSKLALAAVVENTDLYFFCARKKTTALGAQVAHVQTTSGLWLQHALVEGGHVYFMPHTLRPVAADPLRGAEKNARESHKGLWAIGGLSPVHANSDKLQPGWFQIIIGKVLSEKRSRSGTYLNFGKDWATDFTVQIPKRLYRQFTETENQSFGLEGKTIEVRGWVEWAGGPKIILEDAAQLIIIPPIQTK